MEGTGVRGLGLVKAVLSIENSLIVSVKIAYALCGDLEFLF